MNNFVITIERGFGSGGRTIGYDVSRALQIPCYADEILQLASLEGGLNVSLFERMNQKNRNGFLSKYIDPVRYAMHINSPADLKSVTMDKNLFAIQARAIEKLAKAKSCVILGYCANYVLKKHPNVLALNIQAPNHICVSEIIQKYCVPEEEAVQLVSETNQSRAGHYRYFTGREWLDCRDYDAVLNTHRLGRENCVEIIQRLLEQKIDQE